MARKINAKFEGKLIILNLTKKETFSSLMTTKCSWGQPQIFPSCTLHYSLAKRIYLDTQLKEELTDFENFQDVPYYHDWEYDDEHFHNS